MKAVAERRGGVAELVINGPPLNLFDQQMILDMETALAGVHALAQAGDVRAMLLRAEGRTFCGGVDVHEFQGLTPAGGAPLLSRFFHLVQTLEALPIPTLAVVHGLNLTIGFELALGADLLWAAEDASFGLVEATVGLTPGAGGTQRVAARAGSARAAEMVFTGDVYPAAEMYRWGVVNRLLPAGQLLGAARGFADRLAAGPTVAIGAGKHIIRTARDHGIAAADAITVRAVGDLFATQDVAAGIGSLLEQGPHQATFAGR